jgi:hypothetical protein
MESLSIGALSDKAVRYLTGLKRSKLASLADEISVDVEHLFQFYLLCRQNLSQRALAILISVDQSTISRRFHKILDKLADYLIPKYLTFSLDEVRSRVPPMVKLVYPGYKEENWTATQIANYSRFVTKLRNVIERMFGRFKFWKIIANTIDSAYTPILAKLTRVLAATENAYFEPLNNEGHWDDSDVNLFLART